MNERDTRFVVYASKIICLSALIFLCKIAFDRLSWGLCVVLLSFAVAFAAASISKRISRLTKLPQRLCAALLVLAFFLIFGLLAVLAVIRVIKESESLLIWLAERKAAGVGIADTVLGKLPFLKDNPEARLYFENITYSFLSDLSTALGGKMRELLTSFIHATPRAVMGMIVFVMSCFYLAVDYYKILDFLKNIFPKKISDGATAVGKRISRALSGYFRAYVIIFFITFCQLLVGLLILKVPFAFLISLGVAAVDILPVLGSGGVLIPWAVISLCLGNNRLGIGLFMLYGVVTIVRQISEPHIVGGRLGIHPLASLLLMFGGICAFGVWGAVLCPLTAVVVKELMLDKNKKM